MIYVGNQVIKVQILEDLKIIILTPRRLIFSHLKFIEEFISIPTLSPTPQDFYYSPETLQTLVQSPSTLEIFYCNWRTQAKLFRVIILNHQRIDAIFYNDKTGWNIYGEHHEYETVKVKFHPPLKKYEDNIGQLVLGSNFYEFFRNDFTKSSLLENQEASESIVWQDLDLVFKNIGYELEIQGHTCLDGTDLICLNATYILIIKGTQVLSTLQFPNTIYFSGQMIANRKKGQQVVQLNEIDEQKAFHIGQYPISEGRLLGFHLRKNWIYVLEQVQNEIVLNKYPLIDSQQNQLRKSVDKILKQKESGKIEKQKQSQQENQIRISNKSLEKNPHSLSNEEVTTPNFANQFAFGDKWTGFGKKWDENTDKIFQDQSENFIKNPDAVVPSGNLYSRKVECFRDPKKQLTPEIAAEIESSTFVRLMDEVIENNPSKIPQILRQFFLEIVEEHESPFLIERALRTHNPIYSEQKIREAIGPYLNNSMYKQKLTFAFQEFPISEVPEQILNFPPDFIMIIKLICKEMYIGDLLSPNQGTIREIVQSYMKIDNFKKSPIIVQDEEIQLNHPRNLLNILLYLNQSFNLTLESILRVYCEELLIYNQIQTLQHLLIENIFEVCGVERRVFDEILAKRFENLLEETLDNIDFLENVIMLMSDDQQIEYKTRMALIKQLHRNHIRFQLDAILGVKEKSQSNIWQIMQKIIQSNDIFNLLNLKLKFVYLSLYCLQEGEMIKNITNQFLEISKTLAEKCFQAKLIYQGFKLLAPLISQLKTSFIAYLLYTYNQSIFLNRLAGINIEVENFQELFPQYFDEQYNINEIKRDKIQDPKFSESFSCTWSKFSVCFDKYLSMPKQVKFLTYCDFKLAYKLFQTLPEPIQSNFNKFYQLIEDNLIISVASQIDQNEESYDIKNVLPISFRDIQYNRNPNAQKKNYSEIDIYSMDQLLLQEPDKSMVCKSLAFTRKFDPFQSYKKAKSDNRSEDSMLKGKPEFIRLKVLVNQNEVYDALRDIYNTSSIDEFLRALKYIDNQKIVIHNLPKFKQLYLEEPEFNLQMAIPFNVLINQNSTQNLKLMKPIMQKNIQIDNFWIFYKIFEKLLGYELQVVKHMMKKIVQVYQSDRYSQFVREVKDSTSLREEKSFLRQLAQKTKQSNLTKTYQALIL